MMQGSQGRGVLQEAHKADSSGETWRCRHLMKGLWQRQKRGKGELQLVDPSKTDEGEF